MSSNHVRSNILFAEVGSVYELFRSRQRKITIYKGPATDATTKVKTLIAPESDLCMVDLAPRLLSVSKSVTFISEPIPGRCWYCKRWTKDGIRVGVPIKMKDDKFHHMMIVDIEGCACNYSCAYSYLKRECKNDIFTGRLTILYKIFELIFQGKEKLVHAPDFSLLQENGGNLTDEEFDSGARGFTANPFLKYRYCCQVFEATAVPPSSA
jgi:hypothetical protein